MNEAIVYRYICIYRSIYPLINVIDTYTLGLFDVFVVWNIIIRYKLYYPNFKHKIL